MFSYNFGYSKLSYPVAGFHTFRLATAELEAHEKENPPKKIGADTV